MVTEHWAAGFNLCGGNAWYIVKGSSAGAAGPA
jgi:hypothetical protein